MKTASELAHNLQCLLTLRIKAEALMQPARAPEEFQEQQRLFQAIAEGMEGGPWHSHLAELAAYGRFVLDPMGRLGPHGGLNAYWLGEGAVPLGWLLGLLPSLPPPSESVNVVPALEAVKLPHVDRAAAEHFAAAASLAVTEAVATDALTALVAERDRLVEQLRKKKKPTPELQKQASRSIERARWLGWALDIDTPTPRP